MVYEIKVLGCGRLNGAYDGGETIEQARMSACQFRDRLLQNGHMFVVVAIAAKGGDLIELASAPARVAS